MRNCNTAPVSEHFRIKVVFYSFCCFDYLLILVNTRFRLREYKNLKINTLNETYIYNIYINIKSIKCARKTANYLYPLITLKTEVLR